MSVNVAIGVQDFSTLIENHYFYVDKTAFLKEWWDSGDSVTLITRPRRFGKTLTMSMTEQFFSMEYAGRSDLFEELEIWNDEKYRNLQGTYPVISLSFANIKEPTYELTQKKICDLIAQLYFKFDFITESNALIKEEVNLYKKIMNHMDYVDATLSLNYLSGFLYKYYGKKVIILLDEYDTPMQEAFVDGYWEQLVTFTRSLFNATFKTNPALERGIMTGITRVSKESIFSDLNNLKVVTTTSNEYAASFGFTEQEVFSALESFGLENEKNEVKRWYDGFIFGTHKDIYNPWSILNYLDAKQYTTYWANTSANSLVGKLVREGNRLIKEKFEKLLCGECIWSEIDEQIVYNQLDGNEKAVWSLLLAGGYLKVLSYEKYQDIPEGTEPKYQLALTNLEVKLMFQRMIHDWFAPVQPDYNDFVKAMVAGDVVRFVAMFTVVCCHSADPFNFYPGEPPANIDQIKFWGAAYGSFLRPCVPLFVMITGALLLPLKDDTSVFYKKRISRVFWPFLIWSVLYNLFPWITGQLGLSPEVILDFFPYSGEEVARQSLDVSLRYIAEIPLNFSIVDVHMWYIYLLIGLYLYLPVFSAWVEKASEKAKLWFLLAWGVSTLLPYYYQFVSPYVWGGCSWNSFNMLYYFAGFNGYLLLGHYLRNHDWSLNKILLVGIPMFLIGYVVTFFGFRYVTALPEYSEELLELFFTYCSLNVVMMTVPVFLLMKKVDVRSEKIKSLLANLTTCGFGIYMVHYFFTGPGVVLMRALHVPVALQIPAAAVVAFAISWLIVASIYRLMGKNARYVVG